MNIEILQQGLAFGSGTTSNTYSEYTTNALYQATSMKLYVFNKSDLSPVERLYDLTLMKARDSRVVTLSAKTGEGLEELTSQLEELCRLGKTNEIFLFPYAEQGMMNILYKTAEIKKTQEKESQIKLRKIPRNRGKKQRDERRGK